MGNPASTALAQMSLLFRILGKLKPRTRQRYAGIRSPRLVHTEETAHYTARKDSWYSPTILLLGFIPLFTFALGTWQLQRLQWKISLIDELEEKLERDPIRLPRRIKCVEFIPMHMALKHW